ncbi:MAG: hypothetical protein JNN00_16950 [Chitinophagaceae bacterium]|nr:hypothetical protein [Chitinophagaceae bacterium]
MKLYLQLPVLIFLIALSYSCNYVTYSPRSKRQQQREKPSVVLLDRIVEFREEFNSWPFSKEEFTGKGQKYKEAFDGFPYTRTDFKVKDNNTMTFSFYDHIKDMQNYRQSGKVDLNGYWGEVRFFKEKDKFIWKIKMR